LSYQDGWAAINLEMPARVPRTEYSAGTHWDLVRAVTGIEVSSESPDELRAKASQAFIKAWNYDFIWSVTTGRNVFGECKTSMGHATYASGGVDYNDEKSCLFTEPEEALSFDPWEKLGPRDRTEIVKAYNRHYRAGCEAYPDAVNMPGIYITLMSGLIDLFGWDMLLTATGLDPERFGEVANRYSSWIQQYFDALAECESPVVMIHDDIVWTSGAFIHPEWYRKYIFPNLKRQLAPLVESGKRILYTSDGNYTQFIDDIAACGAHGFICEPSTDIGYIAERYGQTHVFVGNADTRILLSGSREQIRAEVERCMAIGKGCPGYFLSVGNHIPSNTPVENALYYNEVYEELSKRR
jgi:hypothetical protein